MTNLITKATPSSGSDPELPEQTSEAGSMPETETSTATQATATPAPRKRSILRRVLRSVLFIVVLAALAAGVVYAAPIINDRIIQPVETNTADTAALQTSVEDSATKIDQLELDLNSLRADLDATTADLATTDETVTANSERLDDVDTLIADQTTRLDALDDLAATLELEIQTGASTTALQIDFLKSTELLSRARLFLYQANYGLAEQDVQAARDLLTTLLESQADTGLVDTVNLASALSRIDLVLEALPARPVAATDDLDIAWRLLLDDPLSPLLASTNSTDPTVLDSPTPPTSDPQD